MIRKKLNFKKKGFTLIELILVISIIAIIVSIASPNYIKYKLQADNENAVNLGRNIYLSAIDYKFINNKLDESSMRNFIQNDLGIKIKSLCLNKNNQNQEVSIMYTVNKKDYVCSFNLSTNEYSICKSNNGNLLYKSY